MMKFLKPQVLCTAFIFAFCLLAASAQQRLSTKSFTVVVPNSLMVVQDPELLKQRGLISNEAFLQVKGDTKAQKGLAALSTQTWPEKANPKTHGSRSYLEEMAKALVGKQGLDSNSGWIKNGSQDFYYAAGAKPTEKGIVKQILLKNDPARRQIFMVIANSRANDTTTFNAFREVLKTIQVH